MSGGCYLPESLAPGVGLFDYDNDGDLDVYLVQGRMLAGEMIGQALFPPQMPLPLGDRLYRNDLEVRPDGTRLLHFTDVTRESGLVSQGYGMGVAAGDIDNDGWVDLYVTRLDANQLFRNNGDGTFVDISATSGTDEGAWSVSASFVDVDRDGWLDLYVGNYVAYGTDSSAACHRSPDDICFCTPDVYPATPDRLYRNRRNGTFEDVTARARVNSAFGPALGVSTADFDGDGWMDIFVANDGRDNQLWMNRRDGTFENTASLAAVAVPDHGVPEASMGVDAGDFDNDGDEDLVVTVLSEEGSNLYVNDGTGVFDDSSAASGLGVPSLAFTGFGAAWIDVDNDGWLDVLTVNGEVQTYAHARAAAGMPLHQGKQLYRNLGDGRFEEITRRAGAALGRPEVSRGAAFGDIDNDGDTDVLVGNSNGRVRLLVNQIGNRRHWIGLRLVSAQGRDLLGARVEILRRDGPTLSRRARADGSYGSANDPRVLAGLGDSTEAPRVRVRWPDGTVEEWPEVPIDRWTTLTEGAD